jgi:hypothetical protein
MKPLLRSGVPHLVACVAALWLAAPTLAGTTNPHIAAFVQYFANGAPATVHCPDTLDEWTNQLGEGEGDPNEVFGRTLTATTVVQFRPDLCPILDNLAQSTADDSTKALAVLTLVHESYHVRHWSWRWNEARVECQAIRHFRIGVLVAGGTHALADRLLPFALSWHAHITQNRAYAFRRCKVPHLPGSTE